MIAQTDVLTQCLHQLASAAQAALGRCLDHVVADLQLLETKSMDVAERDALANNWHYLTRHKAAWGERYASSLLTEFTRSMSAKPATAPAAPIGFGRAGLESAGLVNDAELNQTIDAQRLLQDLLPVVEATLAELDALVSSALGLGHVAPERNPMRPEVFTGLLHGLLTATLEDTASTNLSLKHLAKPLGRELQQLYADAIKALKLANVASASYHYRVQPSAPQASKPQALKSRTHTSGRSGNSGLDGDAQTSHQPVQYVDLTDQTV